MCGPEDPLFTPLLQFARVPFQAKESDHKTPFWENFEILASTASIFTQILALKPPNLEIFSSQALKLGNFQFTSPQIWKFSAHKPSNWEIFSSQAPNLEIFSSQAFKLGNFQFTSPKFGNFQLTSPPFQRQVLVRKPLTSEIRAAHPYLKTVECPPPGYKLNPILLPFNYYPSLRNRLNDTRCTTHSNLVSYTGF